MSAAIHDLNHALTRLPVDAQPHDVRPRTDAQLGIEEVKVFQLLEADLVAPPDAADLAATELAKYDGQITTGDDLRLEQKTKLTGPQLRAAVGRVLAANPQAVSGNREDALAVARMNRMLTALEGVVAEIKQRANAHVRD